MYFFCIPDYKKFQNGFVFDINQKQMFLCVWDVCDCSFVSHLLADTFNNESIFLQHDCKSQSSESEKEIFIKNTL